MTAGRFCGTVREGSFTECEPSRAAAETRAGGSVPPFRGTGPHRTAGGGPDCGKVEAARNLPAANRPATARHDAEIDRLLTAGRRAVAPALAEDEAEVGLRGEMP